MNLATVLAALDDLPWSGMVHCRGPATDVPVLLRRALTSPERADREAARAVLTDALFYQGSSFEPTSHAGAVLMRALPHVDEADRAWLVDWAGGLAQAYTMTEGQGLLRWVPEDHPDRPGVVAQYEREVAWARAARRAGWLAVDELLRMIGSDREELALDAPYALVALVGADGAAPDDAARVAVAESAVDGLVAALARHGASAGSPKVVAGYAHALGGLADVVPRALDALRPLLHGDWPARTAAALQLAWRGDEVAADVLIAALARHAEHEAWFPYPFPWRNGHTRFVIVRVLSHPGVPDAAFARAVPTIADVIRRVTSNGLFEYDVAAPLWRALGEAPVTAGAIPPLARKLLEAVRDSATMWSSSRIGNTDLAMRPFGLKNERDFFRALLA